jgi:hypothetical protein
VGQICTAHTAATKCQNHWQHFKAICVCRLWCLYTVAAARTAPRWGCLCRTEKGLPLFTNSSCLFSDGLHNMHANLQRRRGHKMQSLHNIYVLDIYIYIHFNFWHKWNNFPLHQKPHSQSYHNSTNSSKWKSSPTEE